MTLTYKKFVEQNLDIRSRSGNEWQALCPFHGDTQPSFSVNVKKGLYICYACGAKGNIRQLASFYKTGLVEKEPDINEVLSTLGELSETLKQTSRPAVGIKIPAHLLDSLNGTQYWCGKRNISEDVTKRYNLGYDDINNQAIIPLEDLQRRVLGLIRRNMGDITPRYMYPRGLKISHCLFGAGVAREDYEMFALAKQGVTPKADIISQSYLMPKANRISQHRYQNVEPPALVITEGAIDAMVAYEVGAVGVAMLGSRISEEQVEIIKRLAPPQIIVATDADRAGREAEIQVMAMLRHARLGIPIGSASWSSTLGKDLAELQKTTVTKALAHASVDEDRFRISAMVYGELRTIKAKSQKEMEAAK